MQHLPAYVALQPWVVGRSVLVVAPSELDGARQLVAAGARRVWVVQTDAPSEAGIGCFRSWAEARAALPSVDTVLCIESYAHKDERERAELLEHSLELLTFDGVFAAWASQRSDTIVDFWTLEGELGAHFRQVFMLAQLPWEGVSFAPVLEDTASAPEVALDEALLGDPPTASHYLALGCCSFLDAQSTRLLTERCLLIPSPAAELDVAEASRALEPMKHALQEANILATAEAKRTSLLEAEVETLRQAEQRASGRVRELEHVEDELSEIRRAAEAGRLAQSKLESLESRLHDAQERSRQRDTDLAILSRSVRELETALERANGLAEERHTELNDREEKLVDLRARAESLEAERGNLSRQLEVALVEREGARQLSERVEAELELSRRRASEQETKLQERASESAKLTADVQIARAELEHYKAQLVHAQNREQELSASAAQTVEQGRMLAEVATDRDRLREELGRRAQQIQEFEERLWSSREELEKERLGNVRLGGEAERLRDRAERAHHSEKERAQTIQKLSAELHTLELSRAELAGTVRAREEEITRLRAEQAARSGQTDEAESLRGQLAERSRELAELSARVEQTTAREQEALGIAQRREQQLEEAGSEVERLRGVFEEASSTSSGLQSELEVKSLEVEQLQASISDLQTQLEERREGLESSQSRGDELRRALEQARGEQESLRRRLRKREQELEDIGSANESSGVELFKLRRELEAAARANEQLEEALELGPGGEPGVESVGRDWPQDAVEALRRVHGQLGAQARRHAEQLSARSLDENNTTPREQRFRSLQLEIDVRAEEQEHMLRELDAAEQRIWEMTDASDRNAARLAASLAQLEKHKEELDETRDELEVALKLLAAAEARALEQERLLASERAKLARVGARDGGASTPAKGGIDELFADLEEPEGLGESGQGMVELAAPGSNELRTRSSTGASGVPSTIIDGGSSKQLLKPDARSPRMVVESLPDEDPDEALWSRGVIAAPASAEAADGAGTAPRVARVPKKTNRS